MRLVSSLYLAHVLFIVLRLEPVGAQGPAALTGTVRDASGAVVQGALVALLDGQVSVASAKTDASGKFSVSGPAEKTYVLQVSAEGFDDARTIVRAPWSTPVDVTLEIRPIQTEVTVTADPGTPSDVRSVVQPANVIDQTRIRERAHAVVAQTVNEEVGVNLQRTSPTIAGIFVRGLTGNKVNVFVDGVRYSTASARGGINTFLDLLEPSSLNSIEILRGPNSAQFGSDALGGSVQFLSQWPSVGLGADDEFHGSWGISFGTADLGFGSNLLASYGGRSFGLLANLAGRRTSTIRPGDGIDSHAAVTRFFGLPSSQFGGERLSDTAFTQYGGRLRLQWIPAPRALVTATYLRSQQDGGKRYDQLLGGDGNLVADLRNLMLDLAYVRYDRNELWWFDRGDATYSYNAQREERVNQGGNGNPKAAINHEYERTRVNGIHGSVGRQLDPRQALTIGGEFYGEEVHAPSFGFNPVTGVSTVRRGRVPDGARYRSGGFYAQDVVDVLRDRLRAVLNVRYSGASYRARASDSPIVAGQPLWPDDSLSVSDVTFRVGTIVRVASGFSVSGSVSRGFRAPHTTDLGTLGLTGSGFEVAAPDVQGLNATVGNGAGATAVSTGEPVTQVESETSVNYDVGLHASVGRLTSDLAIFVNTIHQNIDKRALILPAGAVGLELGGQPIVAQGPTGVVFVAAATNPVLVRINADRARLRGIEYSLDWRATRAWLVGLNFTSIHAEEPSTGLPPNIEGGTPAPAAHFRLRYAPPGRSYWIEPFVRATARQDRLSSLDLEDRRTGATRTHSSIRNFFQNGATARGYVGAGADGVLGSADDVLLVTGEALAEIQQRVLGSANSLPLFTFVPAYATVNVRGGVRFAGRHELLVSLENLTDKNYRDISWGLDATGFNIWVSHRMTF